MNTVHDMKYLNLPIKKSYYYRLCFVKCTSILKLFNIADLLVKILQITTDIFTFN